MANRFLLAAMAALILMSNKHAVSAPTESNERPCFELFPGENYFRMDGRPLFVLGRNPAGTTPKAFDDHFFHAALAGERLVRIHFTFLPSGEKPGEIDAGMLQSWDAILDAAEQHKLAVLPVLGVWADWNDGSNHETWHTWDKNPYNVNLGGPAQRPGDLFDDTPCRKLWLKRIETFVRHWSKRRAIVGWEIFSELDLVTGATPERAVAFTQCAAGVIRAADPWKRPITASQAGVDEWPKLLQSNALDFLEIHPYAGRVFTGHLDELILSAVHDRLKKYGKPILIGECGLDSAPPRNSLTTASRAEIGIRCAIWASVVSGAMNGRMLWWEDGYDQFERIDLCTHYQQIAAPAAAFVRDVDFTGFAPVACALSDGLTGAVIGNDHARLGWFRDRRCQPPDWPTKPTSGQSVTLEAPGTFWQIEFIDPVTSNVANKSDLTIRNGSLRIVLPEFQGSIACRLNRR